MKIILLRHGEPADLSFSKINASAFYEWVNLYNYSGLCVSSKPTVEAINISEKCNAVVCSDLPRSIESAKALNIKKITITSSQFNEAGLPTSCGKLLKLSPKTWAVIYRVFWLFGYSNNSESYKEAKSRASKSVNILIKLAQEHGSVLFVGHGVYNWLVAKELKSVGWSGPKKPTSKHWSFGVYKNKKHNE